MLELILFSLSFNLFIFSFFSLSFHLSLICPRPSLIPRRLPATTRRSQPPPATHVIPMHGPMDPLGPLGFQCPWDRHGSLVGEPMGTHPWALGPIGIPKPRGTAWTSLGGPWKPWETHGGHWGHGDIGAMGPREPCGPRKSWFMHVSSYLILSYRI